MRIVSLVSSIVFAISVLGCGGAQYHRKSVSADDGEKVSVGTVQREIRIGMSGAEVAAVLGSPNVVTTDEDRRETWIYDKISTEKAYSTSSGGVASLILGGGLIGSGLLGGAVAPSYDENSGASSTSQKTLTVIIKFGHDKKVRDFAYHTSRF